MAIPLPSYQSLGSMITNQLNQLSQNELLREKIKASQLENEIAPQLNQMKMQQFQEESKRKNELFPEELKRMQLANQLSNLQLEEFKPKNDTERAYKNALIKQMEFKQSNPLYGQPGVAGQIGAAQISDPETARMIMNALNTNLSARSSQSELQKKQAAGYEFNNLPMNSKEYLLAQVAGMGIDPDKGRKLLTSGKTLDQIAMENGYDPENLPDPVYPLTKEGQTQLKMRQSANEEIKKLSKRVSDATSGYSRTILGYSPTQVVDQLKGKNKDSQSKLLAARALQPELAAIRLRMGGGNVGISAIHEMTNSSMGNINTIQALVSPEVYAKAQEYVDEWLSEAVEAANKKSTEGFAKKQSQKEENKKILRYNPETGRLE